MSIVPAIVIVPPRPVTSWPPDMVTVAPDSTCRLSATIMASSHQFEPIEPLTLVVLPLRRMTFCIWS